MNDAIAAQRQILEEAFIVNFRSLETDEDRLMILNWTRAIQNLGSYLFFTGGTIEMIARSLAEDVVIRRFVLSYADTARLFFVQENINFLEPLIERSIKPNTARYLQRDVALLPSSVRAELRILPDDLEQLIDSSDWYLYLYGLIITGAFQTFSAAQDAS